MRHTDFDVWQSVVGNPLTRAITNILEDVRIENATLASYPGTRQTLDAADLARRMVALIQKEAEQPEAGPDGGSEEDSTNGSSSGNGSKEQGDSTSGSDTTDGSKDEDDGPDGMDTADSSKDEGGGYDGTDTDDGTESLADTGQAGPSALQSVLSADVPPSSTRR